MLITELLIAIVPCIVVLLFRHHYRTVCGTPNYIAPEVLNMKGHGFEADVWAIGCIMYAMLAGCPPFETSSLSDTYHRYSQINVSASDNFNTFISISMSWAAPGERMPIFLVSGPNPVFSTFIPTESQTIYILFRTEFPKQPRNSSNGYCARGRRTDRLWTRFYPTISSQLVS